MKRHRQHDVDRAWYVVLACFLLQVLSLGMSFSCAIYTVSWLDSFGETKSATSLVGSINTAMLFFVGPITSIFYSMIEARKLIIFSSILTALGCVAASFATGVTMLYCSFGLITGCGFGFLFTASNSVISQHFDKWKSLAFGLASVGTGAGPLIFAIFHQYLIDVFGWRGALRITAGIILQGCIIGALLRGSPTETNKRFIDHLKVTFDASLFRNFAFILLCLFDIFNAFGSSAALISLPDYIVSKGWSAEEAARLLSYWGVACVVGRCFGAFLSQTNLINMCTVHILYISNLLCGCFVALIGLPNLTMTLYIILVVAFGLAYGSLFSVWSAAFVDIFGRQKFLGVLGWQMIMFGGGYLLGSPSAGHITDITGDFKYGFYLAGAMFVTAGVASCPPAFLNNHSGDHVPVPRQEVVEELEDPA